MDNDRDEDEDWSCGLGSDYRQRNQSPVVALDHQTQHLSLEAIHQASAGVHELSIPPPLELLHSPADANVAGHIMATPTGNGAATPASAAANPLLDDDKLSDSIPDSREVSVSRPGTPDHFIPASSSKLRNQIHAPEPESEEEEDDDMLDGQGSDADADEDADVDMDGGGGTGVTPSKQRRVAEAAERKALRDRRKQQEGVLSGKRAGLEKAKLADSMKRFNYLLGQTELFQHFIDIKRERDPEFAAMLAAEQAKKDGRGKKKANDNRHRKSEKEEDEELLGEADEEDNAFVYEESPAFVKGGKMRDYQVQGLNWMASLHHNGINGILADEMGLGKTLQTISFLGHLKFQLGISGPHLIVVPKSTLDNWKREVAKWVPGFSTVVLQGTKEERAQLINDRILPGDFDILITSYEMCLREKSTFKKFSWEYIIIDEAHRIKNVDSLLSQIVRAFSSRGRLLITGTPLQNNLQELWALLNFILPDVFSSSEDFDAWFKKKGDSKEDQDNVVQQLHKVLRPFLLRRVKADVEKSLLPKKEINLYVGMTEMQRLWYRRLLEKDIDAVNGATGKKEGKTRLLNIVMQLRKCCNHPYLFDGAEPGPPYTTDEHIIENTGKMVILDKLLKSMKAKGSRVLIFSQMSRVLDILEDYCQFRGHQYCRIDGNTAHEDRINAIDEYNAPGSEKFVFLLTTRAGGLGINLVTADIVVLYDSDWNPQADLQAMDRAHRIGQTKQVYVFRFITQDAVEERIIERATQKLKLDQLVIQEGRAQQAVKTANNKEDLLEIIQHGAEKIINSKESMLVDEDIDEIIAKGEAKTQALQSKYENLNLDDLTNFKSDMQAQQWEGENFAGGKPKSGLVWIEPAKRQASKTQHNYSVDQYYSSALKGPPKPDKGPKLPKAPKHVTIHEHHFFPARLKELQDRDMNAYMKSINYVVKADTDAVPKEGSEAKEETPGAAESERKLQQEQIDNAEPLTEEEQQEMATLAEEGFGNWTKRHFQQYIKGMAEHGRDNLKPIAEMIGFPIEEVEEYASIFWQRYQEISDWEKHLERIEAGEKQRTKRQHETAVLQAKVDGIDHPMQKLQITYGQNKGKQYSEEEDRFLLVRLCHWGLHNEQAYDYIKRDIGDWPAFRFDWFIKSRSTQDLQRRAQTLLLCLMKEAPVLKEGKANGTAPKKAAPKKRPVDDIKVESKAGSRKSTPASAVDEKPNAKKKKT